MYYIQLDNETTLENISSLPGIQVVAMLYGGSCVSTIKYKDGHIILDDNGETVIQGYDNNISGYINGDLTTLTLYVPDYNYELGKDFQDYLYNNGIRSIMMHI